MASFAGAGPTSERKKTFKKGVDQEESRRRREETTIQIRKNKKEERLQKRRTAGPGFPPPADPSVTGPSALSDEGSPGKSVCR